MNDFELIYKSLDEFFQASLWQIAISTIASSGIVTLYLKGRSDKQLERFKTQLEIYHFKETLGHVRADQQQAEAIKEIWITLSNQREGMVNFLGACDELDLSKPHSSQGAFIEKMATLGDARNRTRTELLKFSISIDDELAAQISDAHLTIHSVVSGFLLQVSTRLDNAVVQENKNEWQREFLAFVKSFSFVEIDKQLDISIAMMRQRLKVLKPSALDGPAR